MALIDKLGVILNVRCSKFVISYPYHRIFNPINSMIIKRSQMEVEKALTTVQITKINHRNPWWW